MTQEYLFLLVVAITGLFTSRWMSRLAEPLSELPLKTLLATLLAAGMVISTFLPYQASQQLLIVSLVVTPLYVLGPFLLMAIAREKQYGVASRLSRILYWTADGYKAMQRLFAQIALQQGNADAALSLLDKEADQLMLAQAYALKREWPKVLALEVPSRGDNAFLAMAARVEAYLALDRLDQAEAELDTMQQRFTEKEGPIGYRSLRLSEARIAAYKGQVEVVKSKLQPAPQGVPAYILFDIIAQAAKNAQRLEEALGFFTQAYALAPEAQRSLYEDILVQYNQPLPKLARPTRRRQATFGLLLSLVVAYGIQLWLERTFGPNAAIAIGGYVLNIQIPEANAYWRYVSYSFLHGGIVHIGFNAWVLLDIGKLFESRRNWGNLLAAFVLGSVMGAYLTSIAQANQQLVLVGASGGILGIAGALLADVWRSKTPEDRRLMRALVQWMIFIVIFSVLVPNVSLWGHVGGVVGGLLWGFIRQGLPSSRRLDWFIGGLSLGVLAFAIMQMLRVYGAYF